MTGAFKKNVGSPHVPLVKVAMPPRERLIPALEEVLYGGMIGEHVYEFEAGFAAHFGLSNTLAVSGTAALHIALLLAGAGPKTRSYYNVNDRRTD